MTCLILLLLPIIALGQAEFGPIRLDDERTASFYYPDIYPLDSGDLLVTWSGESWNPKGAYGQQVSLQGELLGENIVFDEDTAGVLSCAPSMTMTTFASGYHAELFYYS